MNIEFLPRFLIYIDKQGPHKGEEGSEYYGTGAQALWRPDKKT